MSRKIVIEAGIPIKSPPGTTSRRVTRYPLDEMKVGDSFILSCDRPEVNKTRNRLSSSIRIQRLAHGRKYVTRAVDGGVRVWRVK